VLITLEQYKWMVSRLPDPNEYNERLIQLPVPEMGAAFSPDAPVSTSCDAPVLATFLLEEFWVSSPNVKGRRIFKMWILDGEIDYGGVPMLKAAQKQLITHALVDLWSCPLLSKTNFKAPLEFML